MMCAVPRTLHRDIGQGLAHAVLTKQEMYPFTLSEDLSSLTIPLAVIRHPIDVAVALRAQVCEERGVIGGQHVRPRQGSIVDALGLRLLIEIVDGGRGAG